MKMNDQDMAAAIVTALEEMSSQEVAVHWMEGAKLEIDFDSGRAKLLAGERTEAYPLAYSWVNTAASGYPISRIEMNLPPYPLAQEIAHATLSMSPAGRAAVSEWVRHRMIASVEQWIPHVRHIEAGVLTQLGLSSQVH